MKNMIDMWQCTDCGGVMSTVLACLQCGRRYGKVGDVVIAWPSQMPELAREEAEHHDHDGEDAVEVHQLERPRNRFYHSYLWQELKQLPSGSELLEIGAGSGFDAIQLAENYRLTLSDVSPGTLRRLAQKLQRTDIAYVAADGSALPFADGCFAGVYMVATLHHLPDTAAGIAECARVLTSGGRLVIGMEPNATYFRPIKHLRRLLCSLTNMDPGEGSHADAEMEGFSHRELAQLFGSGMWTNITIRPVWFFAGLWHYGAEFLFRAFKLNQRLVLPVWLERGLIFVDELLFKIPGLKHLGWHWIIIAHKALSSRLK